MKIYQVCRNRPLQLTTSGVYTPSAWLKPKISIWIDLLRCNMHMGQARPVHGHEHLPKSKYLHVYCHQCLSRSLVQNACTAQNLSGKKLRCLPVTRYTSFIFVMVLNSCPIRGGAGFSDRSLRHYDSERSRRVLYPMVRTLDNPKLRTKNQRKTNLITNW